MPGMSEQWVHVQRDFSAPVEQVFGYLAEHENLAAIFGAKVKRLRDGATERNGVGSSRELKIGPLPSFDETVTEYVTDELIEYRITRGGVLDDHVGIMKFSSTPVGGSHLDYRIRVVAKGLLRPLSPVIAKTLTRNIEKGLKGVPGGS
jgi:uncharacterized protein YndB with AHSA1/START domain